MLESWNPGSCDPAWALSTEFWGPPRHRGPDLGIRKEKPTSREGKLGKQSNRQKMETLPRHMHRFNAILNKLLEVNRA